MLDRLRCFAPAEVIYFNAAAQGAYLSRRLSRDSLGEGGSRRRAQISLGAQIVLKADAQAVFPMLTVLMPY